MHVQFTAAYKLGDICANNGKLKKLGPNQEPIWSMNIHYTIYTPTFNSTREKDMPTRNKSCVYAYICIYTHNKKILKIIFSML